MRNQFQFSVMPRLGVIWAFQRDFLCLTAALDYFCRLPLFSFFIEGRCLEICCALALSGPVHPDNAGSSHCALNLPVCRYILVDSNSSWGCYDVYGIPLIRFVTDPLFLLKRLTPRETVS